jgi:aminopeptidase N
MKGMIMKKRCAVAVAVLLSLGIWAPAGSAAGVQELVDSLCDTALEGRVVGSPGCERAAEMVAERFAKAGLVPAGDEGGWYQTFQPDHPVIADAVRLPAGARWGEMKVRNVVGMIRGSGDGCVVLGAHYDHLGRNAAGEVFRGADDNASGVAALCEAAAALAADPAHRRSIVFVAFTGEEEGLLGSQWYVDHPVMPLDKTIAMINFDTIGRLSPEKRLLVLSASSARELPEMLQGINLDFEFDLAVPEKSPFGSDQVSFIVKNVPAMHFFTGPTADYHRTSDTPDKINAEGIASIAAFAAEATRFLADRDRPLTFVPQGVEKPKPSQPSAPRRVSLGTIPDMADQGEGVLVSGVLPGSPAEKAGIQAGDRIVSVDGEKVGGLEDYSGILKSRKPGDRILVTVLRAGKTETFEAALVERK